MSSSDLTEELFHPTSEESEDKERKAKAQGVRDQRLRDLMDTAGGRAHHWELLTRSHQFEPLAVDDPALLQRRVGARDFGLRLYRDLRRACPDLLTLAEREANDRHN